MLKPSVQIHNMDGILVAEFWDCLRLDPAPVQDLRAAYERHANTGGRAEVVVDLSGVGFAGSAALGNFVALYRLARQRGGRLVLCNVDPTVREVLRASKLDSLFEFAGDRADAVRSVKEAPGAAGGDGDHKVDSPPQGAGPQDRPTTAPLSGLAPLRRRSRDPKAT
jgi:anti-anti-sigma factor